jgi:hypothetical protein
VLALLDYAKDAPANVSWDRALRATLARGPHAFEYHAEFFDAARFPDPAHLGVMRDYLENKYAGRPIDVIIAMDLTSRFLARPGAPCSPMSPSCTRRHRPPPRGHQRRSAHDRNPRGVRRRGRLDGARPRDIAPTDAPIVPMFDWRQLQRWGIDEARLPPGSRVLFREVSVWHRRSSP